MQYDRLTTGLAAVLGGLTVVLTVLAIVARNPAIIFVALTFGAATYFVYYHASGRMAARVYQRVERQARVDGGRRTGAGPREEWEPPRDGGTAREAAAGSRRAREASERVRQQRQRKQRQRRQQGRASGRAPTADSGMSAAEAYQRLGLDPSADQSTVKSAYRQKVKEVHPDTDDGDEESFKEVKEAYERLSD
mgnify:CR=1 FL=1